jgi:hypothetical protein
MGAESQISGDLPLSFAPRSLILEASAPPSDSFQIATYLEPSCALYLLERFAGI